MKSEYTSISCSDALKQSRIAIELEGSSADGSPVSVSQQRVDVPNSLRLDVFPSVDDYIEDMMRPLVSEGVEINMTCNITLMFNDGSA